MEKCLLFCERGETRRRNVWVGRWVKCLCEVGKTQFVSLACFLHLSGQMAVVKCKLP